MTAQSHFLISCDALTFKLSTRVVTSNITNALVGPHGTLLPIPLLGASPLFSPCCWRSRGGNTGRTGHMPAAAPLRLGQSCHKPHTCPGEKKNRSITTLMEARPETLVYLHSKSLTFHLDPSSTIIPIQSGMNIFKTTVWYFIHNTLKKTFSSA